MQLIFILKSTEEGRSEEDSIKAIQSLKEERRGRGGWVVSSGGGRKINSS